MKSTEVHFPVTDYALAETLNSGQAFRWQPYREGWAAVVGQHWVHLIQEKQGIIARTAEPVQNWDWLKHYLQVHVNIDQVTGSFPDDEPMRESIQACFGLRLLRQEPWECLASFILSSTKQIVQIRQIVGHLCSRFGTPVAAPEDFGPAYAFPGAAQLAKTTEADLRGCKMGFRAPYLLETAREVSQGRITLARLAELDTETARQELTSLPGVGRKIADCVLLFAYGFPRAFPVDTWVLRGLRELYFPKVKVKPRALAEFADQYFGPNAGYAQQYLFHYLRVKATRPKRPAPSKKSRKSK